MIPSLDHSVDATLYGDMGLAVLRSSWGLSLMRRRLPIHGGH